MSIRHEIMAALDSVEAFEAYQGRTERGASYHAAKRQRQTERREARRASPRVAARAAFEAEAR